MWGGLAVPKTRIISTTTFEKIDMPSDPGAPTLDQLRVFLTVVDVGSFAGAARKLGRATSVISYTVCRHRVIVEVAGDDLLQPRLLISRRSLGSRCSIAGRHANRS